MDARTASYGSGVSYLSSGGDLDSSLQELLTESMEELERQMASKEAETGRASAASDSYAHNSIWLWVNINII